MFKKCSQIVVHTNIMYLKFNFIHANSNADYEIDLLLLEDQFYKKIYFTIMDLNEIGLLFFINPYQSE
jgi:hypothetical protein